MSKASSQLSADATRTSVAAGNHSPPSRRWACRYHRPISRNPLFSTYRAGENRVTSSMLAVFERIGVGTLEALLGAAVRDSALQLVRFENQPPNPGGSTVPDASISARFTYYFEVKTVRGALTEEQLRGHLKALEGSVDDERLIAITPDLTKPVDIDDIADPRLSWASFLDLDQAIDDYLDTQGEIIGDRERYLLRELQALFRNEGLVDPPVDVVIVAANIAYPEYQQLGNYVCQPGRGFRDGVERIAFYADGEIKSEVPKILHRRDHVPMRAEYVVELRTRGEPFDEEVAHFIESWIASSYYSGPESVEQVFLLSGPADSERTLILPAAIRNDSTDRNGRPCPFTYGQLRYTRAATLRQNPETTSKMVELDHAASRRPG